MNLNEDGAKVESKTPSSTKKGVPEEGRNLVLL